MLFCPGSQASDGCMCIQMQLPGGGTMPVRIGLHTGAAADGLVGCANTLQYRCGQGQAQRQMYLQKSLGAVRTWAVHYDL